MTFEYPELSGKRLQLLTEIVPRARRVLMLYDPRDASPRQGAAAAREAAAKLHLILVEREVRNEEEVTRALTELEQVDALLEVPGGAIGPLRGDDPRSERQAPPYDPPRAHREHPGCLDHLRRE